MIEIQLNSYLSFYLSSETKIDTFSELDISD